MKYCKIILDDYDFKYKSKKRSPPIQQRKLIQSLHKNAATPKSRLPKLLIEEKHHSERDSTAYRDFQLATTYHHKLCFNILDMDLIHLNRNILQGYCDRFTYRIHQTNYRVVEYEYIPHLQNNNSTTHIYELLYYTPSTKVEDITQYQQSLNNLTNGLNRTGNQVYLDLPNRLKEFIQSCLSRQIMKVLHYFGDSEHKSLTLLTEAFPVESLSNHFEISSVGDFLLDEFFGGTGDEDFKKKSDEAFKRKILEGRTIVIVSHSMGIITKYCDRVIWLNNGETIKMGKTEDVVNAYRQSFVKKQAS